MRRNLQPPINRPARSGSIIVFVLVFIVLLTFIVTAFLEEAASKIKYYGLFHNRDDLRVDAYSALEIALAVVNQYRDVEGSLWGPEQGWGNPLQEVGFVPEHASSVTLSFEDESAKIPLLEADYALLLALFTELGFPLQEAQSLADGLLDWLDEDDLRRLNGFDGDDYAEFTPPYRPANGPIGSWDEFRLIMPFRELFWDEAGTPHPAWPQLQRSLSLFHRGRINVNGAPPIVLAVLQEQGRLNVHAFEAFLSGPDGVRGTEDDRLLRNNDMGLIAGADGQLATEITLLRIRVQASRGEARFQLEGLVTWTGSNPSAGRGRQQPGDVAPEGNEPAVVDAPQVRTAPDTAAELGYPFRFVRLTENRNF